MSRLVPGYNFLVCLGALTFSFSKITGIGNELNIETINEGGLNDNMIMLLGARKTMSRLVFEHGIGKLNPMNVAFDLAQFGCLFQVPGTIIAYSEGEIRRVYGYEGAVPVKWSLNGFDAQNSSILIDSVEVLCSGIQEIPVSL